MEIFYFSHFHASIYSFRLRRESCDDTNLHLIFIFSPAFLIGIVISIVIWIGQVIDETTHHRQQYLLNPVANCRRLSHVHIYAEIISTYKSWSSKSNVILVPVLSDLCCERLHQTFDYETRVGLWQVLVSTFTLSYGFLTFGKCIWHWDSLKLNITETDPIPRSQILPVWIRCRLLNFIFRSSRSDS